MTSNHLPHHNLTDEDQQEYNKIFKEFIFNIPHNMNPFSPQLDEKKNSHIVEYHWRSPSNTIPSTCNTLYVCFNSPIPVNVIPNNVIILCFLCENKTGFTKGPDFNHPIHPGTIPMSVRYIYFINATYNKPLIAHALPPSVEYLFLSDCYNQAFRAGDLPPNLNILETGDEYNQPFDPLVIPKSLRSLFLGKGYNQPLEFGGLTSLTCLVYDEGSISELPIISLPPNLEFLLLSDAFNHPIEAGMLPPKLKTLTFGDGFNQLLAVGTLPPSLENINFGKVFDQPFLPNVLPHHLKSISFHQFSYFSQTFENIPSHVQTVEFGYTYNKPITSLPSHLKYIKFSEKYNHPIDGVLPQSLTHCYLGKSFKRPLVPGIFPPGLKVLILNGYPKKIPPGTVPANCNFQKNPKQGACSVM
ncbi:hypothetical protein ACTFIY_002263 [Dictyostelium cf. discoideum]